MNDIKKGMKPAPFEGMIKGLLSNIFQMQASQGVMAGLASAASSAAMGIFSLGSAFVSAAPAALKFGNALSAVMQGGIVLKAVFGGVGKAIGAYSKLQDKQAKKDKKDPLEAAENLLRIKEARDALKDAILEGARANEDAVERVKDAEESLADAIEGVADAQENYADSLEAVSDAEENVRDAQTSQEKALKSLNKAREDALERLEDLEIQLDRASLNEERAALNLRKAEKKLAQARAGGNADAIYEADLAYREQAQSLIEVQDRNEHLRKESDKAFQEGVDGNQNVIDAQEAYRDSIEATADAQEALKDAIEGVSDAQEGMADAAERVSDAQRDLKRAMEDVPRTAVDVALKIERAQLSLQKALQADKKEAQAMQEAVDDAFSKLSPAAQKFVKYFVDVVKPKFEELKKIGQEAFFPKFQTAVENIMQSTQLMKILEDTMRNTAGILGDISISFSKAFTQKETLDAVSEILSTNEGILKNLGTAASNLVQPLSQVFAASAPHALTWSENVNKATESFKNLIAEKDKSGELDTIFAEANVTAGKFWEILKDIGAVIWDIGGQALPAGKWLLDEMVKSTQEWRDNMIGTKDAIGIPQGGVDLTEEFQTAAENLKAMLDILDEVAQVFVDIGSNPAVADIAKSAEQAIPVFGQLITDAFNAMAPVIQSLLDALPIFGSFFQETGAFQTFATIMSNIIDALAWFLELILKIPGGDKVLKIAGAFMGVFTALRLITGLMSPLIGKWKLMGRTISGLPGMFKGAIAAMGKFAATTINRLVSMIAQWAAYKAAQRDARASGMGRMESRMEGFRASKQDRKGIREAHARQRVEIDTEYDAKKERAKLEQAGKKLGLDFSDGVEEGIKKGWPENLGDKQSKALITRIKKTWGIASPSRVGITLGQRLGQGILQGLDVLEGVTMIMNEMVRDMEAAINMNLPRLSAAGAKMGQALDGTLDATTETTGTSAVNEIAADAQAAASTAMGSMTGTGSTLGGALDTGMDAVTETTGSAAVQEIARDAQTAASTAVAPLTGTGGTLGGALDTGMDAMTETTGSAAVQEIARDAQAAAATAAAPLVGAGGTLGGALDTGMDAVTETTGSAAVNEIARDASRAATANMPVLVGAGGTAGKAVDTGFDLATEVTGSMAVAEIARDANRAAIANSPALMGAGAKAGGSLATGAGAGARRGMGGAMKGIGKGLMGALGPIMMVAMVVIPLFKQLYDSNEKFRTAVQGIMATLGELFGTIMTAIKPALDVIMQVFTQLVDALAPIFQQLMETIMPIITQLISVLAPIFAQIVTLVMEVVGALAEALMPIIQMLLPVIMELVTVFLNALMPIIEALLPPLIELVGVLLDALMPVIQALIPVFIQIVNVLIAALMPIIEAIIPIIAMLADIFINVLLPAILPLIPIILDLVTMLIDALMPVIEAIIPIIELWADLFINVLLPALLPIIPIILDLVTMLIQALVPVIDALIPIITMLADIFVTQLLPALLPIIPVILDLVTMLIQALVPIIDALMPIITMLADIFVNILLPAILPLLPVIITMITYFMEFVAMVIKFLMPIIVKLIEIVIKVLIPTIEGIAAIIKWVVEKIVDYFTFWWELWQKVFKFIQEKWDQYGKPAIDAVKSAIETVKTTIENVVTGVKTAWGKIIDAVRGPINTVIKGINDWLITPLNTVLDKFGLKISLIPELKAEGGMVGDGSGGSPIGGGFITGPGGPTSDLIPTMLSNGEYVVRARSVRAMGKGAMDYINRHGQLPGGKAGEVFAVADLFGRGGVKEWLQKGVGWALGKIVDVGIDMADQFKGNLIGDLMIAILKKLKEAAEKWGEKKDEEAEAAEAATGGKVPPYDGPPGGWTYPLGRKFRFRTYAGHRNPGSYDIGAPIGTAVIAVSAGKIVTSANKGTKSYGQYLAISHAHGEKSLYGHLSKRIANMSKIVKTGEKIGESGNTGRSSGPHLHFELNQPKSAYKELKRHGVKGVYLARGGVVSATTGGIGAILAEGGRDERVTPLDNEGRTPAEVEMLNVLKGMAERLGEGGNTFQIFPAAGMNETELARKVSREIHFAYRRRS